MKKNTVKKIICVFLLGCLMIPKFNIIAEENIDEPAQPIQVDSVSQNNWKEYSEYCNTFNNVLAEDKEFICKIANTNCPIKDVYEDKANALIFSKDGIADFTVTVSDSSYYNLLFDYAIIKNNSKDETVSISVDRKTPYNALESATLKRYWKNATSKPTVDNKGNQLTPEQILFNGWMSYRLSDDTGVIVDPYKVYLSAGVHQISIKCLSGNFLLSRLSVVSVEKIEKYSSKSQKKTSKNKSDIIYVQGEEANLKSTKSIIPKSDNSSVTLTPHSATSDMLNYIGSTTWQNPGEEVCWKFNVKKSGNYKLAFHFKQSDVINGESWRWMKIDGKTPFEESKRIRFTYSPEWQYAKFTDDKGVPYSIWLEAGTHTISLEVTLGDVAKYYQRLSDIVEVLSAEYMEIVMVTSDSPDVNRDYELFKQLPNLNNTLKVTYKRLLSLANDMQNMTGKRSNQYVAALKNMARVLKNMYDSPYYAHQYVKDYYSNYCTVSSWLYDMKKMPVWIDEIQIVPYSKNYPTKNDGFWDSLLFSLKRFFVSFAQDYNRETNSNDNVELELWVNWGLDQASALNQLIQDSFTPETGIDVNLRVTNASLVKGILSGNFPDISLHLARTEPVNLGIRGALYDLSKFEDYEEITKRFQLGASVPYTYKDVVYALPDTQNFYMMFYRSDILKQFDLKVPKTWDEFIRAATIIQRNNMQIYVPYTQIATTTTVNTGLGGLNLFATLLMQKNIPLYNKSHDACLLNSIDTIHTFEFWTDLYSDYKYLKEADFYNRFRVGSMPIGIAQYSTYNTLADAAPEIKGKWNMTTIPGFAEGNYISAGSGTGCSIVKKSPHIKEAWEFLKWWTSSDIQLRYTNQVESMLGVVSRQQTSNVEALKNMTWPTEVRDAILKQWECVEELPEIPGSYYLTRAVDQAYWEVINKDKDSKSTLDKWNRIANEEINRKISEYS